MSKAWNPLSGLWTRNLLAERRRLLLAAPAVSALVLMTSCQDNDLLQPGDIETNVVVAVYQYASPMSELPLPNQIELDGVALQQEWGAPDDPNGPFTMIRCTAENGAGFPGDTKYVAMKARYSDDHLFLLLKWTDPRPDDRKDALFYTGPDIPHGRPASERCWDPLMDAANWTRDFGGGRREEDRLVLAFEMEPAGDSRGTFASHGCQVACHPGMSPQFGRPGYGRLDVWQWMSTRTNLLRNLYVETDHPVFPRFGIPAYLDDYVMDSASGLIPDPGRSGWFPNWIGETDLPRFVYRPTDDSCFDYNEFGEECRVNNLLPVYYIFKERLDRIVPEFSACDTINHVARPEPRLWRRGDAVTGYFYTYPEGSRADVRGKALWDEDDNTWTLEIGRRLNTGDPYNDVIFDGRPGEEVVFTLCVMDNSRTDHWGSAPQVLRFGPKERKGSKVLAADAAGEGTVDEDR